MKKTILLTIIILILVAIVLLAGLWLWKNTLTATDEPSVPATVISTEDEITVATTPTETEPPETEIESTTETEVPDWGLYQTELLNIQTEKWVGPDDTWEKGQYTDASAITADLYLHGFKEICMFPTIKDVDNGNCKITDVEYYIKDGRAHLTLTYITNIGTSKEMSGRWEIHAEHTGEPLDISGVGNPYWVLDSGRYLYIRFNHWSYAYDESPDEMEEDDTWVSLFYAPNTGNMYSLHGSLVTGPTPSFLFNEASYVPDAFDNPPSEPILWEFSIYAVGADTKTYQFNIGMTCNDWVNSEFNTDGWYRSGSNIFSPDGKYFLRGSATIYPIMNASIR